MIEINNLSFTYPNKNKVFEDVSLEIGSGLTYLIGGNGSGKSTLIRLIMGILKPQKGVINIDGANIKNFRLGKMGEINGYLMQNPDSMLFANSVFEELAFPMILEGIAQDVIKDRVSRALDMFGLSGREEDYPLTLSQGQRQRLALASIFMRKPKRLILDEPTSRLDKGMRAEFYSLITSLLDNGKEVIIATHDNELMDKLIGKTIQMETL